jgi:hypothetical protein
MTVYKTRNHFGQHVCTVTGTIATSTYATLQQAAVIHSMPLLSLIQPVPHSHALTPHPTALPVTSPAPAPA